jgi:hypothetical protein
MVCDERGHEIAAVPSVGDSDRDTMSKWSFGGQLVWRDVLPYLLKARPRKQQWRDRIS